MRKRVAVIGAGPSGLVTIKELLEEGHEPTCFERAPAPGGVFRFGERDGVIWDSCRLTSSGLITAFSDFPVPADRTGHMMAVEYLDYLARYSDAFGLGPCIRFGTTVESVARDPDGRWTVRTIDGGGARREERYDAVAICCGQNQHPHVPSYPGLDSFTGMVMHGSQYRRPGAMAGKRVLVVGGGESGGDISAEVSRVAAETVLSLRRGVAVLPRRRRNMPNDYRTCRLNNCAPHWIHQTKHPADDWKRRIYTAVFLPLVVLDKVVQSGSIAVNELVELLRRSGRPPTLRQARVEWRVRRISGQLLQESGGTIAEQYGTKGDEFVRAIAMGRSRRAGTIAAFEGSRVRFDDGSSFEPDVVIFCTGFEPRVTFLDEASARTPRFLHLFNPSVGASLAFVGFVRPTKGAIPPVSELQARYFALLLSGKLALPPEAEMRRVIDRQVAMRRHAFRAVKGRLEQLVDYAPFCDQLAARIGCQPTREAVRRESIAFRFRFFAAPIAAAQYRLVGPHAKPEIARQVISTLPVSHPLPMLGLFYLRWALSRLLHRVLGEPFTPNLALPRASASTT